jgi:hypothetical protein
MSQKITQNSFGRGGGSPQLDKNNQVRRGGSGKFRARGGNSRFGERHGGAAQKDNVAKIGARSDLVCLTYCEKGSSALLTNLKEFEEGLRIISGREFGTLFDFERTGAYPNFAPTRFTSQKLADEIEITSIQDNIDDPDTDEGTRTELLVAIEIIRRSQIRSAGKRNPLIVEGSKPGKLNVL